jgi:integrase
VLNKKKVKQDLNKKKSNKAYFVVDLRSINGTRKYFWSNQEAQRFLDKIIKNNNTHMENVDSWTIKDLLGPYPNNDVRYEWDERIKNNNPLRHFYYHEYYRMKKGKPLPQYFDSYKNVFHAFLEIKIGFTTLGDMKVSELTAAHCKTFIIPTLANSGKKGMRGYKTLVSMRSMFNKLMIHGKICGCIRQNPMEDIVIERDLENLEPKQPKVKISSEFIHKIERHLPTNILLPFKFACSTGLRAGEQRALTWNDINFKTFEVTVNKAAKLKVDGGIGRVKTRTSNRTLPITPQILEALKNLYTKQGQPDGFELIFKDKDNKMINPSIWREQLQAVVRKITNKHLVWHDLRHYYASKMLEFYGNDLWTVSNLMGHSDINITQRTYGHWMLDKARREKLKNDIEQINF